MSKHPHTTPLTTLAPTPPAATAISWWFSADAKRGFCWDAVSGYDYRAASPNGSSATLYLYITSGIFHVHGPEAEKLHELARERIKP